MKSIITILIGLPIMLLFSSCVNSKRTAKFTEKALTVKSDLNLPEDFKTRTFLKKLVAERNNPALLPGRLIKVESIDTNNSINVVRLPYLFSKEGKEPGLEILKNDELIRLKITNKSNTAASVKAILDLSVETNESYEVFIADVLISTIPDLAIDTDSLVSYYQRMINPAQVNKYYFVSNVKLSRYSYQKYTEIESGANIDGGSVIALEGKLYNSQDALFRDYFISASLVPLTDLLPNNIEPRPIPTDASEMIKKNKIQILNVTSE